MSAPDGRDDDDLIERIAGGDRDAFQVLFDRRVNDVFRLSYSLLLDRQMAEDAAQETFVKLWLHAADWRPEAAPKTWLLTVARNLCLDMIRKHRNELKKRQALFDDRVPDLDGFARADAENEVDRKERRKVVNAALFRLPPRQREAVVLVYFMEVTNSDAARIVGVKVAAFDSLLARARRSLRALLGDESGVKGLFDGYH